MENKIEYAKSLLLFEHKPDCQALVWVKELQSPTVWNVIDIQHRFYCGEDGRDVDVTKTGHSTLYFEFCCGDKSCPARKRVHARAVVEL